MSETISKGTFLKRDSKVTGYMVYPRFLLQTDLNETARMIYVLLLDRARLSINRGGWVDEEGNVYIIYDIKSLAADCRKSEGTVKAALHALEKADLIFREKQEVGKVGSFMLRRGQKTVPRRGQKIILTVDRKRSLTRIEN